MGFWQRLWCSPHVWKETHREYLREDRDVYIQGSYTDPTIYKDFKYYAVTEECLKCGKKIIYEKRYIKNI
jgi:hypothetical protein